MEGDIEDGELIESDDEASKIRVENDEIRSKMSLLASTLWNGVPVSGGGSELGYMKTLTSSIMTSRRLPEGLPSSESEKEEETDGSDEDGPCKRQKFSCGAKENVSCTGDKMPLASVNHLVNGRKTHKNNVWASVVQDQILSSDMIGWSGLDQAVESDRNVESYNYLKAKEQGHLHTPALAEPQEMIPDVLADRVPDISEMETFGTVSSGKRGDSIRNSTDAEKDGKGSERPWLKRNRRGNSSRGPVHNRLGSRNFDKYKVRSHIRVTPSSEATAVVDELLRVLREPESMKDIFCRVVQTVGVEDALNFLYETEDLEDAGGLMTVDGRRRRTPGGVYLYLVKTGVSKDRHDLIFQQQKEDLKRQKKALKARRKKKLDDQRAAMEAALGLAAPKDSGSVAMASVKDEESEPVKCESQRMDEEEAEDVEIDCLDEPDPSVNIELDFA